nr:reverse transcriptase domain-containing protein [Tanacetum cinerariifolium]
MRTRSRSRHKIVEPLRIEFHSQEDQFQEDPLVATMTDNRTMAEMLREPTEGYAEAIVVPPILVEQFELKHSIINMMTSEQFFGLEKDNPHDHVRAARRWLEKEPPRSITTWEDLVSKYKDLLRACPHHGFTKLYQLNTFYNALNPTDQDSLNAACLAAGGNTFPEFRDNIQEYVSAAAANYNQGNPGYRLQGVANQMRPPGCYNTGFRPQMDANQIRPPGFPPVQNNQNNFNRGNNFTQNRGGSGILPSNTVTNPKEDLKGITTRSGVAYKGPTIPTPSKVVKQGTKVTKDQVQTPCSQSTAHVQPPVTQSETPISEPIAAPVSAPMPNLKQLIPYPSRRDNERRREQANEQIEKFYEIFKDMSFKISITEALILMPKFASTLKALIGNKEKLSEMARTLMNEHCSTVILNKLPKKLGDPGKFLIPYEFLGMDECLALADLGASINLMPLSVWKELTLPELTPTCMTLELADRSVSKPIDIAKDISVKIGMFHFPADFVVVDFEPDPRVPLILGRFFLKTGYALIDVHKGELTLRIKNEAITYNLDQTSRYSANYDQMTTNKIDVTNEACEEYFQEVLGFFDVTASGSLTPFNDPIVSTTSPTLTPFGDSDFLLFEEANAFLGLEDDPDSPELDSSYYDPKGDIQMLKAILNSDPAPSLPNHEQSVPSFTNELKACEAKTIKSFVDEPPEVELKDLPPHLEYAFLEGDN